MQTCGVALMNNVDSIFSEIFFFLRRGLQKGKRYEWRSPVAKHLG